MDTIPQGIPQKQCTKCKQFFPATYAYFTKDLQKKDGLRSDCKKCRGYMSLGVGPKEKREDEKQCTKCLKFFPPTLEYFHKHARLGLQPRCKTCRSEDAKLYDEAHKEEKSAHARQYHANNRDRINAHQKQYRQENKQVINARRRDNYVFEREKRLETHRKSYQKRKEHVKIQHHRYYAANTLLFRARDARRRAAELKAQGSYTAQDIKDQHKRQSGKCYYCRQKVRLGKHHVDHVVPLTRGGSNSPENLVIACPRCNISKSNKLPHEWPQGGRLF